jgi:hypothetical protein
MFRLGDMYYLYLTCTRDVTIAELYAAQKLLWWCALALKHANNDIAMHAAMHAALARTSRADECVNADKCSLPNAKQPVRFHSEEIWTEQSSM